MPHFMASIRRLTTAVSWQRSLNAQHAFHKDVRFRRDIFRAPIARYCSCSGVKYAVNSSNTSSTDTGDSHSTIPPADHRALGTAQDLFTTSSYSPGSPLFLPNGTRIVNKLLSFLRAQYNQYGFQEVLTPNIYKKSLWEISGHWQNYKDDMYEVSGRGASGQAEAGEIGEDESYGLKPMNCPGHCLLFKSQNHSYRELPVRYADFSPLHRNEVSGSLSGLTRVRRFHQDDGHIFCRPQQIRREIGLALEFTDMVMRTFNLGKYELVLSTRPEKDFIGSLELWDSAERQLKDALDSTNRTWELNEGDGAFYGPKIDIRLQDSDGKSHQLSTIQLDVNLPRRFGLEYKVAEGEEDYDPTTPGKATPVLIHRAIFGSIERFLALLIEHYGGRWPFWLSPRQGIVLPVYHGDRVVRGAEEAAAKISGCRPLLQPLDEEDPKPAAQALSSADMTFQIDVDSSNRSLKKRIQEAKQKKYNFIYVLGEKNLEDGSVDVDISGQTQGMDQDAAAKFLADVPGLDEAVPSKTKSVRMKVDDVYPWLMQLERSFQ